jgi:hypothetical protein
MVLMPYVAAGDRIIGDFQYTRTVHRFMDAEVWIRKWRYKFQRPTCADHLRRACRYGTSEYVRGRGVGPGQFESVRHRTEQTRSDTDQTRTRST